MLAPNHLLRQAFGRSEFSWIFIELLIFLGDFLEVPPECGQEFHDQPWLFHGGGLSKKGNGTNCIGGSIILKLGEGIRFIFQGMGISNSMKLGDSEFALRAFSECFWNCS